MRNMSNGRASIELDRFTRLQNLNTLLTQAQARVDHDAPTPITNNLPCALSTSPPNFGVFGEYKLSRSTYYEVGSDIMDEVLQDNMTALATEVAVPPAGNSDEPPSALMPPLNATPGQHFSDSKHQTSPIDDHSLLSSPTVTASEDPSNIPDMTSAGSSVPSLAEAQSGILSPADVATAGSSPAVPSKLMTALSELFESYQRSVAQIAITSADPSSIPLRNEAEKLDLPLAQQYTNSKRQEALAEVEGAIWSDIRTKDVLALGDTIYRQLQRRTFALLEQSLAITESYDRRNNPPTAQTYDECKEILDALGVPWTVPDGPYEAEALASSLVVHGHADYVISEDTVSKEYLPNVILSIHCP